MKIQFWPPAMCEHLLGLYEYDRETGFVTRRHYPGRGPKNYGPVGSLSANGDLLLTVAFEGRQWMVRITKLAYFLATGKQYHKVVWKNGMKTDNRFDNLLPLEPELTSVEDYIKQKHERIVENRVAHAERLAAAQTLANELARKRFDEQMRLKEEFQKKKLAAKLENNPILAEKRAQAQARLDRAKKQKEDHEAFLRNHPSGVVEYKYTKEELANSVLTNSYSRIQAELLAAQREEMWREDGVWTGCTYNDVKWFLEKCNQAFGTLSPAEVWESYKEVTSAFGNDQEIYDKWLSSLEKWEHDRLYCAKMMVFLQRGDLTERSLSAQMSFYKWRGKEVQPRTELTPANMLKLEALVNQERINYDAHAQLSEAYEDAKQQLEIEQAH